MVCPGEVGEKGKGAGETAYNRIDRVWIYSCLDLGAKALILVECS